MCVHAVRDHASRTGPIMPCVYLMLFFFFCFPDLMSWWKQKQTFQCSFSVSSNVLTGSFCFDLWLYFLNLSLNKSDGSAAGSIGHLDGSVCYNAVKLLVWSGHWFNWGVQIQKVTDAVESEQFSIKLKNKTMNHREKLIQHIKLFSCSRTGRKR